MYPVSDTFKIAAKELVQVHDIIGTIGTANFTKDNIVQGSLNFTNQCTDTNDVVLGSAYIGQMTATFTGINIANKKWIKKKIIPEFALVYNGSHYSLPMGIYTIKEAKHTAEGVQVTAYDNMIKFDKKFKPKQFKFEGTLWDFISLVCTKCNMTCANTSAQIAAMPNGSETVKIYGADADDEEAKDKFANDINTYRDLIFWIAQTMGCFATITRDGKLIFKRYTQDVVDDIDDAHRLAGAAFEDYITHYIGIYVTDMDTNEDVYYGYGETELRQQIAETTSELEDAADDLDQIDDDLEELERKHDAHEITDEEYQTQKAALTAQRKETVKLIGKLEKRLAWLQEALDEAEDGDGADMDLGANPFLQDENLAKKDRMRRRVLSSLSSISYTPFSCSTVTGVMYDLGDVLHFTGGHSDNDFCCIMSYDYTFNGEYNMDGYGVDPSIPMVRSKTEKKADAAKKDATKAISESGGGGGGYIIGVKSEIKTVQYVLIN